MVSDLNQYVIYSLFCVMQKKILGVIYDYESPGEV